MRKFFILLVISVLPLLSGAQTQAEVDGLWYRLYDADETSGISAAYAEVINSQSNSYTGNIVIPPSVTYNDVSYPVTSIASGAFGSCEITKVEIPSSIVSVGANAFNYCQNLHTIVSKIEDPFAIETSAFVLNYYNDNGVEIRTPSGAVLYVPSGSTSKYQALEGWNQVLAIVEGDAKEGTSGDLKYMCATGSMVATVIRDDSYSNLENVTIPASVTIDGGTYNVKYVGARAFYERYYIQSFTFDGGIEAISYAAFQSCHSATFASIPSSLSYIGEEAFFNCNGIRSLSIPNGCKSIEQNAFGCCYGLKDLELPSSLTSIGNYAFQSCRDLMTVISRISSPFEITQSVFGTTSGSRWDESSQQYVTTYTKSDATLYVPDGTKSSYEAIDGWNMFADIFEGELKEVTVDGLIYSYLDGKGIAAVKGRANDEMRNITIPGSVPIDGANYLVKSIGAGAFQSCGLDSVVVGEGIETIEKNAFRENWNLKSVVFPSTLKTIGEYAFYNCEYNLRKIELPTSLDSIGNYAFSRIRNLTTVISRIQRPFNINENVFSIEENWDYSGESPKQTFTKSPATLYVPDGTKSSYQAIDGWNMFEEIIEGEPKYSTVEGINYLCVTSSKIAKVIGLENTDVRKIVIPSTIPVDDVTYTVKEIGAGAFQGCSNIDTLVIQTGIETIARNAFNDCYNLVDVTIPEGVTTIGESAFSNIGSWNSKPVKVVLPSTLASIGSEAFAYIYNLTSVVSRIQNPFVINENVFRYNYESRYDDEKQKTVYTPSKATLYVPDGTSAKYKELDGWNMFADIIEGELKEVTVNGLIYSYLDGKGTATVVGRADENLSDIEIPGTIPVGDVSYSVKAIGAGAFYDISLQSVKISEGIEIIEKRAFWDSDGIYELSLPSTLRIIGDEAFTYAYFTSLVLPEGLDSIGRAAFRQCYRIQKIELPSTLTKIGEEAFRNCNNVGNVTSRIQTPFEISESVFCLGSSSTYDETQQKDVYTYIPSNANLYVPEGTKAKYEAIKGWKMFANIYEGELYEVVIDSLKYAYLPGSGTAMVVSGDYEKLRNVTIPASIAVDGSAYLVKEIGAGAFLGRSNIESFTINANIETIGNQAFSSCYNATFSELPTSLKSIGESAFYNCGRIVNLEIPEGVTTIGREAFADCNSMQKLILPSSLTDIGEWAFRWCNNLTTVTSRIRTPFAISQSVFSNGANSEWDEDKQQYITIYQPCGATLCVPEGTLTEYKKFEGWMMFADYVEGELREATVDGLAYIFNISKKTATVTKGDNYSELRKVEIPANVTIEDVSCKVTSIASRAFSGTYITSVTIEDGGVESIGQEAFQSCSQLGSISLPSSLTSIGNGAFRDCYRLSSILIPASVNDIGLSAFAGCKVLKSLDVAADNEKFESRGCNAVIERESNTLVVGCLGTVIPESVAAIGQEAFINLDIKELNIPSSVKTIGENAFNSCHQLTEVVLPEGLETLSNTAFHSCSGLTLIELPKSLKTLGGWAFQACVNLVNVVSNIEDPKGFENYVFGEDDEVYSRATLWVPKGMVDTYKKLEGWGRFLKYDELLRDTLPMPTVSYNGRYMTMQIPEQYKANIYYSTDGSVPTIQYSDTITISNLGTIQAVAKRFGSYTVDTTRYEVTYLFDGVTARTTSGGLLAKCFEWSGTDKVEMLDIAGTLNDEDFGTIRGLSKLNTLNMAASEMATGVIPAEAFANTKLQWYVSPYTMTGVGANIFKGCDLLAAITWNSSSVELPEDVAADVANPNMLVYAKAQAMIPYTIKNVVVNGFANNIILSDSVGNNNFYCPEEFIARRISYTHNYTQTTKRSVSQGWETIALPFTVSKITHEKNGALTPIAVEGAEKPFWLYELGDNGLEAATQIRANIPYLICMPNDDDYGDEYMQGGHVTFSAQNATITTSNGTAVSHGVRQFVPTYQRIAASSDVYVLNVNEAVGDNPMGSAFIQNLREVRPFEAYSVHSTNKSRIISVSSLGGGDATGIKDLMLKNDVEFDDSVVKVYSLSGALIKQGKRDDVLRTLPKGLYIINGKKIIK